MHCRKPAKWNVIYRILKSSVHIKKAEARPSRFRLFNSLCQICLSVSLSDAKFLADILGNGVLVDEEVHRLSGNEGLGHVPGALVVAVFAP